MIKLAGSENFLPNLYTYLEKLQEVCAVCQRKAKQLCRIRVSLHYEDCVLNRMVLLLLLKLNGNPVIHIVDRDTHF